MAHYYDEILEIPNAYDAVGDNLYIGGLLEDYSRFRHVICLTPMYYPHLDLPTQSVWCHPFTDDSNVPSDEFIADCVKQIATSVEAGPTLVHCAAGVNRSALMVTLYLVRHRQYSPIDAIQYIRDIRSPSVLSNEYFYNRVLLG